MGPLGRLAAFVLLALAALPAPAAAADDQALAALQRLDARVQTVGWRLARGNARFCEATMPAIGLQLHDVFNYRDPAAVRQALALGSDMAVQAVAAGAPAARAGLAVNDSLSEVAGLQVADLPAVAPGDHARLFGLHDRIDAALAAHGAVALAVLRPDGTARLTIAGEEVCVTRFELITDGNRAAADGRRVIVSDKLVAFLAEDDQLAALLAHELAHNVLGHRARLDARGRTWSNVLVTEREADRLTVWLLANAGYDPAASLRFMAGWGPQNDHGIFSSPDHDRWKTRYRRIARELERLAEAQAASGEANWQRDYARAEPRS